MTSKTTNWHENAFFGVHYDLHARADDIELGAELTADLLKQWLVRIKPDWIQCDCKGHRGYASWPTKTGSPCPGIVKDALRIHRDVTAELGIKLGMHYSGVWDARAVELHPDWACVETADGSVSDKKVCLLGPYVDELMIPQMLELIDTYDIDGFWVDGDNWGARPCFCDRCTTEFTRRTGIEPVPAGPEHDKWDAWLAFHRHLFVEYVTKYTNAVHARKAGCMVCSNWMYTIRQPDAITAPIDYISGDFSPAWGADRAAIEGRFIDSRNITWDLMAWGFLKNADPAVAESTPWAYKPVTHLCQEVSEVIALGGAVMVYTQPERSGHLVSWQHDRLAEVAEYCRVRRDVCYRSRTASETAVAHLADHYYAHNDPLFNLGTSSQSVEGAVHAMLETGRSTDLISDAAGLDRIDDYKLLIVPEQTRLSDSLIANLDRYARQGGHVVLSGAHLADECPDLIGATPAGDPVDADIYLQVDPDTVPVHGPFQTVMPYPDTSVLAWRLCDQEPGKDTTDQPIVTQRRIGNGSIIAVHAPVFRSYFLAHYPALRRFVAKLIAGLDISWKVVTEAPPYVETIVRRKDDILMINLLNRSVREALSAHRTIVEDISPVDNVVVHVDRPDRPASVTVVPDDAKINWHFTDGRLTVKLKQLDIHRVIVIA